MISWYVAHVFFKLLWNGPSRAFIIIIIIIIIIMSLVTGLFFPVILLNQKWSPPLRLQASHCSTFRIMCDVPSIAVIIIIIIIITAVWAANRATIRGVVVWGGGNKGRN